MKITVCELPHWPEQLAYSWAALCEHASGHRSELVLLPEFAFVEPIWEVGHFDYSRWAAAVALSDEWLSRLPELHASYVVGTRPVTVAGQHYNEGYLWSRQEGYVPLRRKYFLPNEAGAWEARWFARGSEEFPEFTAGGLSFGLNICTELWALDTYSSYASLSINAILAPRATAAATTSKWLSVGTVAAVRSGAYSLSSNRVHPDGSYGGAGWIIGPDGELLAKTSRRAPFSTLNIDLIAAAIACRTYPRYVFAAT